MISIVKLTNKMNLNIGLVTFNMGNAQCDMFDSILNDCKSKDLYVIGLQESSFNVKTVDDSGTGSPETMHKSGRLNALKRSISGVNNSQSDKDQQPAKNWAEHIERDLKEILLEFILVCLESCNSLIKCNLNINRLHIIFNYKCNFLSLQNLPSHKLSVM